MPKLKNTLSGEREIADCISVSQLSVRFPREASTMFCGKRR